MRTWRDRGSRDKKEEENVEGQRERSWISGPRERPVVTYA
jgi:hypothetical protein